ncbi:hypothetical protein KO495_02920 [Colwellia sp. D2M02]|uniref:hypothetical protein n=1 Tax=Colwellia sp. D2M02 TaxID=2841562 RepID=UPI001C089AEE|nr:hypothetical protein [Colwellia sp. D2M02]MBU2892272.1 hypothetical protein [Colwellia sp. D2M02]
MSSWEVGPFENDDGADILSVWNEYLSDTALTWGMEKTYSFFEDVYFKTRLPIITDGNADKVIAIAIKFSETFDNIPSKLKKLVGEAIAWELHLKVLSEWKSKSNKRKKSLLASADKLGVINSIPKINQRASNYSEEINSLKTWFANLERINNVRETMSIKDFDFIDSIKPAFASEVEKLTRIYDESDEDGSAELGHLRYLYLIWYVLFSLEFDSDEIIGTIERKRL